MTDLAAIRARAAAATPGPWRWFDERHGAYLATPDRGRLHVLRCFRRGPGAEPRFRSGAAMRAGVDHPDADFIAHARQDVDDLLDLIDTLIGERPPYHVLEVGPTGWALQHEARCFPDLLSCPIHATVSAAMDALDEDLPAGRYRLGPDGLIVARQLLVPVDVEVDADA